jgi:hypothetical protein
MRLRAWPLFQFDKQQYEDCPNSNRRGKLRRLCLLQCAASRKRKRQAKHRHGREYSEDQFAFRVHRRFPSPSRFVRRAGSSNRVVPGTASTFYAGMPLERKATCAVMRSVGPQQAARTKRPGLRRRSDLVLLARRYAAAPHGAATPHGAAAPHRTVVPNRSESG